MATGTIVGKGLYLELVPVKGDPNRVTQILFTPEGYAENGDYVPFSMHSRTVATYSPRKQWRVTRCSVNNKELLATGEPVGKITAQEKAITMTEGFQGTIARMIVDFTTGDNLWTLRGKPISIEITSFDLSEVAGFKTPAPALRRIQKCRVGLALPEKLV